MPGGAHPPTKAPPPALGTRVAPLFDHLDSRIIRLETVQGHHTTAMVGYQHLYQLVGQIHEEQHILKEQLSGVLQAVRAVQEALEAVHEDVAENRQNLLNLTGKVEHLDTLDLAMTVDQVASELDMVSRQVNALQSSVDLLAESPSDHNEEVSVIFREA